MFNLYQKSSSTFWTGFLHQLLPAILEVRLQQAKRLSLWVTTFKSQAEKARKCVSQCFFSSKESFTESVNSVGNRIYSNASNLSETLIQSAPFPTKFLLEFSILKYISNRFDWIPVTKNAFLATLRQSEISNLKFRFWKSGYPAV